SAWNPHRIAGGADSRSKLPGDRQDYEYHKQPTDDANALGYLCTARWAGFGFVRHLGAAFLALNQGHGKLLDV
ncbi:hypothetical protein M8834_32560, partial [Pseudomonas aeruginosa]